MAISLVKGQRVSLTKDNSGLSDITVGLGWDTNMYDGGGDFDLDAVVFLLGENGNVQSDADFVFYGNLTHSSGAVIHSGDNRDGDGEGDDEQIKVNLSAIPANISKVVFGVTIHEANERGQNFGQVSNAFIRVVDVSTGDEILRYDLAEDFSVETAVVVGELYRRDNEWKFAATGSGSSGGLVALCRNFGVNV